MGLKWDVYIKKWEFHGILCIWDCNGIYIYMYTIPDYIYIYIYRIYGLLMGSWNIYDYIYITIMMDVYGCKSLRSWQIS